MYDEDYPMDSGYSFPDEYENNWALDTTPTVILTIVLALLIIIGALGNGLVCWVVVRNRKMWTTRNMLIVNLALSDLLLCTFTMPSTFVEISTKSYILGLIVCKLTLALKTASMFVSTFSIVAIVLVSWNLNQEIDMRQVAFRSAVIKMAIIWVGAIALAMPLFIYRKIGTLRHVHTTDVYFCTDNWFTIPVPGYYSYYRPFSMIVQYGLSIMTITIVFVWVKLRAIRSNSSTPSPTTIITLQQSKLPLSIFAIFCIGWLPLNLYNIAIDLHWLNHPAIINFVNFLVAYALCYMAGMVSSCCNPFLYAWLDKSFKAEFKDLFHGLKKRSKCLRFSRNGSSNSLDHVPNHELMHLQAKKI